jgi:hypothetical protein
LSPRLSRRRSGEQPALIGGEKGRASGLFLCLVLTQAICFFATFGEVVPEPQSSDGEIPLFVSTNDRWRAFKVASGMFRLIGVNFHQRGNAMQKLIAVLIAAMFAGFTLNVAAADKAADKKAEAKKDEKKAEAKK